MSPTPRRIFTPLVVAGVAASITLPFEAAAQQARPADIATPEAIVTATYDAINRRPGADYDWSRFRSLFLPNARLIPNVQQTSGQFTAMTVDDFVRWVDAGTTVGQPDDRGFAEEEIAHRIERYGVIAQVFSTYQKRFWDDDQILGRGINSFQLVHNGGRWWIAGIVWDEETSGVDIPRRYLP
jgi:hypothetical protein